MGDALKYIDYTQLQIENKQVRNLSIFESWKDSFGLYNLFNYCLVNIRKS